MGFESIILSSPDRGLSLEKDIRLVKLALLYSDKVTLLSPKTSMIVGAIQLGSLNENQRLSFIKEVDPDFSVSQLDEYLEIVKDLKKKKIRSKPELAILGKYKSMMRKFEKEFYGVAEKFYSDSKFEQLMPLIEAGNLELKDFDFNVLEDDQFAEYMSNEIEDILSMSGSKYPIFDELMGDIAYRYSVENNFSFEKQNPLEIEMGKELILELPNIDLISVEDLLTLKHELNIELSRFKGAIFDFSKEVESTPFSKEASQEIKKQYEYHIKPELNLLRNQMNENKFYKHLRDEMLSNASSHLTQASVLLGVCSIFEFEKILSISGVLGETGYKAYKKKAENKKNLKENPLFFYTQLNNVKN